jgi:hypothetical protein
VHAERVSRLCDSAPGDDDGETMDEDQDDDAELVASVAAGFVGKLGTEAVPYLRTQEAASACEGDSLSAEAWHDIADAAALILSRIN